MNEKKKKTSEKKPKITLMESCMLRTLHQEANIKVSDIIKNKSKYPGFSKYSAATLYRHAVKPLDGSAPQDNRTLNRGRPRKGTPQDLRAIKRHINILRVEVGTFTSNVLQVSAGVTGMSNSTFRRYLRSLGYKYRRTRKKGMLTKKDLKLRLRFARKVKRLFSHNDNGSMVLWKRGISLYVDGAGFEYKQNPYYNSKAPSAREWRLKNEGLEYGCTAKGSKEGKTQIKFLVGIAHNKGVVLCEHLNQKMNGKYYASIVRRTFPAAFKKTMSPKAKRVLIDGDPSQNSKKALQAIRRIGARPFKIPARSPDLNPIENLFHLARNKLHRQARTRKITNESKEEFVLRVSNTLQSFNPEIIDKIIESMPKRINMIIKRRGHRIKY